MSSEDITNLPSGTMSSDDLPPTPPAAPPRTPPRVLSSKLSKDSIITAEAINLYDSYESDDDYELHKAWKVTSEEWRDNLPTGCFIRSSDHAGDYAFFRGTIDDFCELRNEELKKAEQEWGVHCDDLTAGVHLSRCVEGVEGRLWILRHDLCTELADHEEG